MVKRMCVSRLMRLGVASAGLWLAASVLADETQGTGEAARRPPWGDGTPPWVKDGQVDEAVRAAWRAKRALSSGKAGTAGPPADASPEERRAYRRQRAAERAAAAAPAAKEAQVGHGGDHPHGGHDAGNHAGTAAPAGDDRSGVAPRWGGARDATLWLTDAPPSRGGRPGGWSGGHGEGHGGGTGSRPQGDGGMNMAENGADGVPGKRVWLRQGNNPLTARPATGEETALLLAPDGKASEVPAEPHGGPYNVTFPMPELGYYNVYLLRRTLDQDTLGILAAKVETARAGMGHGGGSEVSVAPRLDARVPVEILRERKAKEALFTRVNYGDEIAFQVLKGGRPVQNARVTFASGQGWSNSVQSDEDGRAVFTVIRDYYPRDWPLFDKRHRETWLVTASFMTPEAGEYQGGKYASTRYTATLSGAYYPGVADYESYSDGLLIGLAGLLFTGTGVYVYRRRRVRPFREVRFDD
jgi:hypothetical protein